MSKFIETADGSFVRADAIKIVKRSAGVREWLGVLENGNVVSFDDEFEPSNALAEVVPARDGFFAVRRIGDGFATSPVVAWKVRSGGYVRPVTLDPRVCRDAVDGDDGVIVFAVGGRGVDVDYGGTWSSYEVFQNAVAKDAKDTARAARRAAAE